MIAIGVRYLCGWSASTDVASRMEAEWPPHAARLYMAMAAAHFETGSEPEERAALEWLESQSVPLLACSSADQTRHRDVVGVYVPVNDVEGKKEALPTARPKQLRTFPRVRPDDDTVYFLWDATPNIETCAALSALCGKVTRVGHSSSLVQVWLQEENDLKVTPTLMPDPHGAISMRVPRAGLLQYLELAFNGSAVAEYQQLQEAATYSSPRERKKINQAIVEKFPDGPPLSRRPEIGTWEGYSAIERVVADQEIVPGVFDSKILVLSRLEGPSLNLESTIQLTGALRDAVMKTTMQPPPEWISGHQPDGGPSQRPHLAFFPLPYVGGEYGDGHVLGLGIAMPRAIDAEEMREAIGPLFFNPETGEPRTLTLWKTWRGGEEKSWEWIIGREDRVHPPQSLRGQTWTEPSREWASVTPVVLHHHPKRNREGHVEEIVREACLTAGLPQPLEVATSPVSRFRGAGRATELPPFNEGGASLCRYQTHVRLLFDRPVAGPVLVGRGRYRGYGLFRPLSRQQK